MEKLQKQEPKQNVFLAQSAAPGKSPAQEKKASRPKIPNKKKQKVTRPKSSYPKSRSKSNEPAKTEPWHEKYLKGAKVYKLTAFTTVDSIEKKFKIYRRQAVLTKLLVTLILIFLILTVIGLKFSEPIKEFLRLITP